jgi:sec-independent protein translocase protein TatB
MLDIGGLELLVIVVVALVAIGPKELPGAIRTGMSWMRKTRALAHEFQSGLEELSREAGVHEIRRDMEEVAKSEDLENIARGFEKDIADEDTRKILEDPDTKKLLAEIESGDYFGSPAEYAPVEELKPEDEDKKIAEAPPGVTGS